MANKWLKSIEAAAKKLDGQYDVLIGISSKAEEGDSLLINNMDKPTAIDMLAEVLCSVAENDEDEIAFCRAVDDYRQEED